MIMRHILSVAALCVALCGCSLPTLTGNPVTDLAPVTNSISSTSASAQQTKAAIAKITAADLQAALADATAHDDVAAVNCYQALLPVIQSQEAVSAGAGAISAFQNARDMVKLVDGSGSVAIACAALNASVKSDVLSLGALFGLP